MIYSFNIEDGYKRFTGPFNKLYSKTFIKLNEEIETFIKSYPKCSDTKRNMYMYSSDDLFINIMDIKPKTYKFYKYVSDIYYNKYKDIYDKLYELGLYKIKGYEKYKTERLEIYILGIYYNDNLFDINIKFTCEKIHENINIDKLKFIKNSKIKGTLIDYCVKYIINQNIDEAVKYIKSCNSIEIPDYINNCNNTKELIDIIFGDIFYENINKFKKLFCGINISDFYINFEKEIYGEPDLISDDYIIDIKTSESKNIDNNKNMCQIIKYANLTNKNKMCLYDPLNGYIYKSSINK
jgi:hypothetical protein